MTPEQIAEKAIVSGVCCNPDDGHALMLFSPGREPPYTWRPAYQLDRMPQEKAEDFRDGLREWLAEVIREALN